MAYRGFVMGGESPTLGNDDDDSLADAFRACGCGNVKRGEFVRYILELGRELMRARMK